MASWLRYDLASAGVATREPSDVDLGSRGWSGPMPMFSVLSRKTYYRARGVTPADVSRASWRKSSFSNLNGSCVETAPLRPDRIAIRDTKDNGTGPLLVFTRSEWNAFIAGAKEGQFDYF
jgi:hypothetical protein